MTVFGAAFRCPFLARVWTTWLELNGSSGLTTLTKVQLGRAFQRTTDVMALQSPRVCLFNVVLGKNSSTYQWGSSNYGAPPLPTCVAFFHVCAGSFHTCMGLLSACVGCCPLCVWALSWIRAPPIEGPLNQWLDPTLYIFKFLSVRLYDLNLADDPNKLIRFIN